MYHIYTRIRSRKTLKIFIHKPKRLEYPIQVLIEQNRKKISQNPIKNVENMSLKHDKMKNKILLTQLFVSMFMYLVHE